MFCSENIPTIMEMERLRLFSLKFFVVLALTSFQLVHAKERSDFISIDCGIPVNSSYKDDTTGLNYVSDALFIDSGVTHDIADGIYAEDSFASKQLQNLRSFPDGLRNCYNIELLSNQTFLIRAYFLYGNYDGMDKLPTFDLYLGAKKWVSVEILDASSPNIVELIHNTSTMNYVYVCLVNTDFGTPFISALELRPLKDNPYVITSGSLARSAAYDLGSTTNQTVRYPDDINDRLWYPSHPDVCSDIDTPETMYSGIDAFRPPSRVMQTACSPMDQNMGLNLVIETAEILDLCFYIYMHFAEIQQLQDDETRTFNISLNGKFWETVNPEYLRPLTIYSGSPIEGGKFEFSLYEVENSTLPPLLNAFESYYVVELSQLLTNQGDVDAIRNIKSKYEITRNWQGDPCDPSNFTWQGLNCSIDDNSFPTIIYLNLSSSGLEGEIAPDFANLKSLQILDLSNNSLKGEVPEYLSQLTSLNTLKLNGNNFTGTIPSDILERWKSGSLSLSFDGRCQSGSCTTKKKENKVVVIAVASIGAVFILVAVATILSWCLLRKKKNTPVLGRPESLERQKSLELKRRQFSYSEVKEMTKNFERKLGEGGFGAVFSGKLDNQEVAVKMLSEKSAQGYKEFQAEVSVLLRVHHNMLTELVGYCFEGTNMGLIYEYMRYGNLRDNLSGSRSGNLLRWETRLKIAHGAAQGLEYLHRGCKPPIIHRDVKTTNILLNDKLEPKLSDFGLSRAFPDGVSHIYTDVAGTLGYLDPEYYEENLLTEKSDVYSFGVVLLEIITGRPHVIATTNDGKINIGPWVQSILNAEDVRKIVDPRLQGDFDVNSVSKYVKLALACLSKTSDRRPAMNQVVAEVNECLTAEMARATNGTQTSVSMNVHAL